MTVEVIGVDHVFVSIGDLGRSEEFYDRVMAILGFRKGEGIISGDPHLFYYNRQATEPRYYPEYAPDYYATFFEDPDGVRLEVMNFRETRRKVMYDWEARTGL